jgi:hypothetical protein
MVDAYQKYWDTYGYPKFPNGRVEDWRASRS